MAIGSISVMTDSGAVTVLEAPAEVVATVEHFLKFVPADTGHFLRVLVQTRYWFVGEYFDLSPSAEVEFVYSQDDLRREYLKLLCSDIAEEFEESYSLSFEKLNDGVWIPGELPEDSKLSYFPF